MASLTEVTLQVPPKSLLSFLKVLEMRLLEVDTSYKNIPIYVKRDYVL